MLIGKTLYSLSKNGNVKTWKIDVYDCGNSGALLAITTQACIGGKETIRREHIIRGKNLGKSNETSPFEQATSEANSRINKQIDKGYCTTIPSQNLNSLGLPQPMLAYTIDDVKPSLPLFIQPKLNGHRALVTRKNGELIMYSRRGKLITTMQHILDELNGIVHEGDIIDGELYLHGEMLQNIGSLIKREQPDSKLVEYHVYDIIQDEPFDSRHRWLSAILDFAMTQKVVLVPTCQIPDIDSITDRYNDFLSQGFEGAMLRNGTLPYEAGFRSRSLLKIKPHEDAEFQIIGVKEGKEKNVNGVKLKVAVFICVTADGKEFDVLCHGTQEEKDKAWHERDSYIGKMLTVQYMGITAEGKPFHPVSIGLRDDP